MMQVQKSTSMQPDLDWSQVRETIRMLTLSVAQIEMVMKDGDDSVGTLTNSFTSMAGELKFVEKMTRLIDAGNLDSMKKTVVDHCEVIDEKMETAIIAFQFYDRLTQRLAHVLNSLENLTALVSEPQRLYNPNEWQVLQETIRSRYTIERDKKMFDVLMKGGDVKAALLAWQESADTTSGGDDDPVELF